MTALTQATATALRSAGLDPDRVTALTRAALAEDLDPRGDLTSAATVPADAVLSARFVARSGGVVAGIPVLAAISELTVPGRRFRALSADGDHIRPATALAQITGPARAVLAMERTALNITGRLCGIATLTRAWVDAVAGTHARIRDTRKTMPLLRDLDKYAVRCGGGLNHRHGLSDAILIKDNHTAAAGGIGPALDAAHAAHPHADIVVQVEVDNLDQLDQALTRTPAQILLDNFTPDQIREAVRRTRHRSPRTLLEASGGLTLDHAAAVAATGVDFLAVGALTHSAPNLDIGLDAHEPPPRPIRRATPYGIART